MAEIYRAKTFDSEGRARLVAVKRVLQHLTADEDFIRMLVDEAKITATLDHPAIARVYEFSQTGDEYFIAMEYVDGKDVRAVLEKHRALKVPIPIEHAVWVIANVAEGLNAAHTQTDADGKPMQIVHRDVSPSNVLCAYQGDVKLCDFGIAKATLTRVQTRTGVIKGKVKYMSPEQAMGRKLDARSDLFSLGTVLYEMLTLEAPFIAQTEVELIFAVRDARKRDARELVPAIPVALNQILNRTMERQRTDRFQSGRELARELRGFLEKNYPDYRRGNLGRFMRALFKEEIEKELRQLESWVMNTADASQVGVNLIADALPENAPYRGFSAASSHGLAADEVLPQKGDLPAQRTSIYLRDQAPIEDLHAQNTQILSREGGAAPARTRGELHQQATMMLDGRAADELRAQIRAVSAPRDPSMHENQTKLFEDAPPPAPEEDAASGSTDLPSQSTRILLRSDPALPAIPPPPAPPQPRAIPSVSRAIPSVSRPIPSVSRPIAAPRSSGPPPVPVTVAKTLPPKLPITPKPRIQQDTAPDASPRSFLDDSRESTMPKAPGSESIIADFSGTEGEDSANPTNPRAEHDFDEG